MSDTWLVAIAVGSIILFTYFFFEKLKKTRAGAKLADWAYGDLFYVVMPVLLGSALGLLGMLHIKAISLGLQILIGAASGIASSFLYKVGLEVAKAKLKLSPTLGKAEVDDEPQPPAKAE